MINKILIIILLNIITISQLFCKIKPDENKIYYHIHQAIRWAETYHSKKYIFSKKEIERHLGRVKYTQIRLVDSIFYEDYLFLKKLSQNLLSSSYVEIERYREKIHFKAQKLQIEHPKNWQEEFSFLN